MKLRAGVGCATGERHSSNGSYAGKRADRPNGGQRALAGERYRGRAVIGHPRIEGKAEVRAVCLAANYGSLVRLHFPNARIVADRFHVIRSNRGRCRPNWSLEMAICSLTGNAHSPFHAEPAHQLSTMRELCEVERSAGPLWTCFTCVTTSLNHLLPHPRLLQKVRRNLVLDRVDLGRRRLAHRGRRNGIGPAVTRRASMPSTGTWLKWEWRRRKGRALVSRSRTPPWIVT